MPRLKIIIVIIVMTVMMKVMMASEMISIPAFLALF